MKNRIISVLFPKRCPFCREVIPAEKDFCDSCKSKLPGVVYEEFIMGGVPCCAPLLYIDEYAYAVKCFKFGKKKYYARPLALLLLYAVLDVYDLTSFDYVTFVPMHKKKLRREGFNHAALLAKELSKLTGIPCAELLEKYKKNKPQHTLSRSRRFENVKGVYRVIDKSVVKNKKILLIDDIMTTGNTIGQCAEMLKKAGCVNVSCAVVCVTPS